MRVGDNLYFKRDFLFESPLSHTLEEVVAQVIDYNPQARTVDVFVFETGQIKRVFNEALVANSRQPDASVIGVNLPERFANPQCSQCGSYKLDSFITVDRGKRMRSYDCKNCMEKYWEYM